MALTVSYCQHSAKSVQNSAIEVWRHDDVASFESLLSILTKRLYTFPKRQKARTFRFALFSDGINYFLSSFTSPVHWRYDLDEETNPYFMERLGINAAMRSGEMYMNGK